MLKPLPHKAFSHLKVVKAFKVVYLNSKRETAFCFKVNREKLHAWRNSGYSV